MNEEIKKFTDELAKEVINRLSEGDIKAAVTKTKESKGSGQFRVVISTDDIDRHGESVDQNGLQTDLYMENAVVLWAHDHWSMPVGVCESITRDTIERDGKTVIRTIAEGYFVDADINPMGPQLARAYEAGVLTKTSIGFIVREIVGNQITKSELLEFSFVPIPANPYTENLLKQNAMDLAMLKSAGIFSSIKEGETVENTEEAPKAEETAPEATEEKPQDAPGETETPEPTVDPEAPAPEAAAEESPSTEEAEPVAEAAPVEEAPAASENPEDASAEQTPGDTEVEKTGAAEIETKAGRVLSASNEKKLVEAADLFKQASALITEVLSAVQSDEGKAADAGTGEPTPLEKTASPETNAQPAPIAAIKELDDYLEIQSFLRSVETAARSALGNVNSKIKEHKENK